MQEINLALKSSVPNLLVDLWERSQTGNLPHRPIILQLLLPILDTVSDPSLHTTAITGWPRPLENNYLIGTRLEFLNFEGITGILSCKDHFKTLVDFNQEEAAVEDMLKISSCELQGAKVTEPTQDTSKDPADMVLLVLI